MSDSIAFGGLAFRRRSDFISGDNSTKRPSILSLNYTQGDTEGGGQSIVITGNNFRSVSAVTFGVAGNASVVVDSRTQITATLPAMKFGSLPSFDGVNDFVANATAIGTLLPTAGYFYWILFRVNSIDSASTTAITDAYQNDALFIDTGGFLGPTLRLNGTTPYVQTYHYAGATGYGNEHEIVIGKWHCLCVRHDGSDVRSSLDGGVVSTTAATSYTGGANTLQIAAGYTGKFTHVDIAEIGMVGSAQDDALFTTIVASLNADYNLNLGAVSPAAYDRTSLACTLLLQEGNYSAGTWTGTASAGSSGGRDATEATNYPAARTPGHEAIVSLTITNNIGESDPYSFEYWDPTVDGATRVVYDSIHTAYNSTSREWTPRYVKPKVNPAYTGLAESIDNTDTPAVPGPSASEGAPSFAGDGSTYGLRTRTSALTWNEVLGASDASTKPGTIVLVQKYLDTTSAGWSGPTPYANEAFIGEHAGGTIGLGGEYDTASPPDVPVVSGHIWHPSLGYRTIKVEVPAHGDKMMVFSRFGANGSGNFGVGVNGDTSGSTYSETIHVGGTYNEGAGDSYTASPVDFGYKYDASSSPTNQTAQGIVYTAVVQDARASDATITKLYKWTQQRFGV